MCSGRQILHGAVSSHDRMSARSSPILIRLALFGDQQPGYSLLVTSIAPYLSLSGHDSEIASQLMVSLACQQPDQAARPDTATKIIPTT